MAEDLTANGEREVFFEMNGQLRSVFIKDKEAVKVCSNPRLWLDFSPQNTSFSVMLLPFKHVTGRGYVGLLSIANNILIKHL
jgi:hypothetical protein